MDNKKETKECEIVDSPLPVSGTTVKYCRTHKIDCNSWGHCPNDAPQQMELFPDLRDLYTKQVSIAAGNALKEPHTMYIDFNSNGQVPKSVLTEEL